MSEELHAGFTGSRNGTQPAQDLTLLRVIGHLRHSLGYTWLHNGDCEGSDHRAACLWRRTGGLVWGHPPLANKARAWFDFDRKEEPRDYGARNMHIVVASSVLIATPSTFAEQMRGSGTWMTIRMARRLKVPYMIILPNGEISGDSNFST